MKKFAIVVLCLVLLFTLVACDFIGLGKNNNNNTGDNNTNTGDNNNNNNNTDDNNNSDNNSNNGDNNNTGNNSNNGSDNNNGDTEKQYDLARFSDETTAQNTKFYKKYSAKEKDLYYLLWKETTRVSIKIDITPYELAKINEAYSNYANTGNSTQMDTYRKCNLTITVNGEEYYYEEVGIHMRGNTSKRNFCDEYGNIYAFVHFRFNLTETFDGEEYASGAWGSDIAKTWDDPAARAERKDRSFATMEKFYYKWNKNYDNTYVREVYANRMFREYGILVPHITLSQILLKQNGGFQNVGVGTLYETVDKRFIKRNFSSTEAGGDLYKCAYPANFTKNPNYGVETPTQRFTYTLKTNDDRTSPDYNHNKYLKALVDILNSTDKNASDFREKLEKLVDMDYFTYFEAVNYLLGNPDCIRNNMNNFYVYFVPETGEMFIIPYDYDRCLGINVDWNPSGDGMTSTKPYDVKAHSARVENPLYTKTILSGGLQYYKDMYKSKLQKVLDGEWFTYDNFRKIFNEYKGNYENLVTPSDLICLQCGGSLRLDRFVMSERGTSDLWSSDDNISTQMYMELKRQCAAANL